MRSGVLSHLKVAMQFLCSASSHLISTYLVCLRLDDHKSQLPNQGLPRQSPPYTPSPACTGPVLLLFCWLSPHENQSLTILCPKKMMFFVLLFFLFSVSFCVGEAMKTSIFLGSHRLHLLQGPWTSTPLPAAGRRPWRSSAAAAVRSGGGRRCSECGGDDLSSSVGINTCDIS